MNLVKELRTRTGMQQKELALLVGVSRPTVSEWEHQKKDPSGDRLRKLAEIFGVDPGVVLGYQIATASISMSSGDSATRIPVLGTIPAGIPIEAIEDILDWEEIPSDWTRGGKEYFALRVSGDSMYPRYEDGDVIILRKTDACSSGQDCAVMVNGGDATFKRVRYDRGATMLVPINPEYETYVYSAEQVQSLPVRILGVVVELRRKVKT